MHRNFNVLLVEDNDIFRDTLVGILVENFNDIQIREVGSAEDALLAAQDLNPDIVFMDIGLPGQNGLEATRTLKSRCADLRVIVLTSYDLPEYRQQAIRSGADLFVSKTDRACLKSVIAEVEETMHNSKMRTSQECSSASPEALLRRQKCHRTGKTRFQSVWSSLLDAWCRGSQAMRDWRFEIVVGK